MIKYHYAINELGEEIDISNVTPEYRKNHSFRCSYCGAPMVARLGTSNTPHFAHSSGCIDCGNGESDLHKFAKRTISSRFLSSEHFIIGIQQNVKCGVQDCIFRDDNTEDGECFTEQVKQYDLKKWDYDSCEEEVSIGDYKADLLITSSSNKKRPPILVEIAVKHPCEEGKINSGLRIIEVPVESYEDVDRYINEGFITHDPSEYRSSIIAKTPKFYGFAKNCYSKESLNQRLIMVARLWSNGTIATTMFEDSLQCKDLDHAVSEPGSFFAAFDIPGRHIYHKDVRDYVVVIAMENGFLFTNMERYTRDWQESMKRKMTKEGVKYKVFPPQIIV